MTYIGPPILRRTLKARKEEQMPGEVGLQDTIRGCEPPTKPRDEAVWQAWLARNHAQELRRSATRIKTVKWVSVVILVAATVFGSQLAFYGVIVRFVLTLAAIVVMSDSPGK